MSELALIDRRPSRRLWLLAAAGALALHVGGVAFAIARLSADDEGDGLGTNAVEVGVEWASPHVEDTDLPAGPDVEAQMAQPQVPDQKAEGKPTDLPQDTPDQTDDPDRVVTEHKSVKPTEEDPKVEAAQLNYSPPAEYQAPTAQQTLENAREAATTTAPNIGLGKDRAKLTADWGRKISAYFEMHKRYPDVEKGRNARVKVSLVLNRLGHILSVAVAETSGDAVFDQAAVEMIHRSDPVPRPPAKLTDDQFNFSLDVNFTKPK